jgi:acyl-CoA oxidase
MAPMHTNLSGLKALFSELGHEGTKTMRECCGAAGFSKYSGIAACISAASPLVTLEGDSVVMNLQTARALLKGGRQVLVKGKQVSKYLAYINDIKKIAEFEVT